MIHNTEGLLNAILDLLDEKVAVIRRDAVLVLVNASATDDGAATILGANNDLVRFCVNEILNETSTLADPCAMLLSNTSRPRANVEQVLDILLAIEHSIDRLLTSFTRKGYNTKEMTLNYIGKERTCVISLVRCDVIPLFNFSSDFKQFDAM